MRKPSAASVLAVLLALSWIGFFASSPLAQEAAKPAVQKWEYWMVTVPVGNLRPNQNIDDYTKSLTGEGAKGWELHTSASVGNGSVLHTFRRRK